ncbi:MAG: BamA/TamA family outer membrane protein [Myxococcota bacterium]|nr:BamA/TamA family outer membrane protein [Myxococcota bacterium]
MHLALKTTALLLSLLSHTAFAQPNVAATSTATTDSPSVLLLEGIENPEPDSDLTAPPIAGSDTVILETIEIIGNEKTTVDVILRRIGIRADEVLVDDVIEAGRLRLLATGYFRSVEFSLRRGSRRGRVILVVEVEERNTMMISGLYYGTSEVENAFGGLSLYESNFLGEGVGTGFGFVLGDNRKAAELDVFLPDLSGTPLQLAVSAIYAEGEEQLGDNIIAPIPMKYSRYGTQFGFGLSTGAAQRVLFNYRFEAIQTERLPNLDPAALRSAPSILFDDSVLASFGLTYEFDTRDDSFVPLLGSHLLLSIETGTRLLGSNYEFTKYQLQFERAFNTVSGQSLVTSFQGGIIQGTTPFFNQFFLRDHLAFISGRASLPRQIGLNFSRDTDYDDLLAHLRFTYYVPFFGGGDFLLQSFIYASIDAGVSASLDEYQEDKEGRGIRRQMPLAADVGIKFDTTIGRFVLSVAYISDLIW